MVGSAVVGLPADRLLRPSEAPLRSDRLRFARPAFQLDKKYEGRDSLAALQPLRPPEDQPRQIRDTRIDDYRVPAKGPTYRSPTHRHI